MSKGIFIIGTDTEVGKTVVSAGLMYLLLKNHYQAAYFKPVASGEVAYEGVPAPGDAAFVSVVSGFAEAMQQVTPFSFADAVAPHLASRRAGVRIDPATVRQNLDFLKSRYEWIVGEAAGGLAVPLTDDGYMQYDLLRELNFPCLLVARAGLGTLNHTLLTLKAADSCGLKIKGIVVNRVGDTETEKDNVEMIKKLSGVNTVLCLPAVSGVDTEKLEPGNLRDVFEQAMDISGVVAWMENI